jgi:hypothetical protein
LNDPEASADERAALLLAIAATIVEETYGEEVAEESATERTLETAAEGNGGA